MKKPPDLIKNYIETPEWFNNNFTTNIKYPDKNDQNYIIKSIINSEKFLLNNDFSNFSFINNIKTFDINTFAKTYNNKINKINNNNNLSHKQKKYKT